MNSVDVDLALLLVSVVTVVPLCKAIDVSPVLGFLAVGLLLNQEAGGRGRPTGRSIRRHTYELQPSPSF